MTNPAFKTCLARHLTFIQSQSNKRKKVVHWFYTSYADYQILGCTYDSAADVGKCFAPIDANIKEAQHLPLRSRMLASKDDGNSPADPQALVNAPRIYLIILPRYKVLSIQLTGTLLLIYICELLELKVDNQTPIEKAKESSDLPHSMNLN